MPDFPLSHYLYQALHAEYGVIVQTNDPQRARQKLYAEQRKDEALKGISILISRTSPESELLLVKK